MEESNKRIAKNTVYLYIRMFVIMALSFITTRVVLDKLGASNYGINNLVGGFVSMFTVLNSILNTSTSRFLALYLGKNDRNLLKETFSTAFTLHLAIAILLVIILEIGGLWFLNTQLNIEPDRMWAARWVFHLAVFNVFWQVTQTPFTAIVTAHEHFNMYAVMSIYDVVAKLLVLYLLIVISFDKLVVYAILQMFVSFTSVWIYRIYCLRKFSECSMSLKINRPLALEMLKFSGWGTFGHVITVVNAQGTSIILNLFFDTIMNAARGLANTVNFTIAQFIAGFMTAAQPQLVKFWGAGDKEKFENLIFNVTQYSIFLLALIGVPALLEIDFVIHLWLGDNVPAYTTAFVQITLICGVIYRSNTMIDQGITAAGYVKHLNMISVPFYLLSLPLTYGALWLGWGPIAAYWISSVPPLCAFVVNLILIKRYINFPSGKYFVQIFLKNIFIIAICYCIPYLVQRTMSQGWSRFIIICCLSELTTILILWLFGLNHDTRAMVIRKFVKRK